MPKNEVGPVSHTTCKVDREEVKPLNKMQSGLNNRGNCPDPRYKAPTKDRLEDKSDVIKIKVPMSPRTPFGRQNKNSHTGRK